MARDRTGRRGLRSEVKHEEVPSLNYDTIKQGGQIELNANREELIYYFKWILKKYSVDIVFKILNNDLGIKEVYLTEKELEEARVVAKEEYKKVWG